MLLGAGDPRPRLDGSYRCDARKEKKAGGLTSARAPGQRALTSTAGGGVTLDRRRAARSHGSDARFERSPNGSLDPPHTTSVDADGAGAQLFLPSRVQFSAELFLLRFRGAPLVRESFPECFHMFRASLEHFGGDQVLRVSLVGIDLVQIEWHRVLFLFFSFVCVSVSRGSASSSIAADCRGTRSVEAATR